MGSQASQTCFSVDGWFMCACGCELETDVAPLILRLSAFTAVTTLLARSCHSCLTVFFNGQRYIMDRQEEKARCFGSCGFKPKHKGADFRMQKCVPAANCICTVSLDFTARRKRCCLAGIAKKFSLAKKDEK